MHIAVNLGMQKIASFQVDNFLPEEIDHELNSAMDRFIKQRYTPFANKYRKGFEQSQKRIDDLRNLVVEGLSPVFYNGISINTLKGAFYRDRAALPTDYLFLVNLRAEIIDPCRTLATDIETTEVKFQRIDLTAPQAGYVLHKISVVLYDGEAATDIIYESNGLSLDQLLNSENYTVTVTPTLSVEEGLANATASTSPSADSNEFFLKLAETFTGSIETKTYWGLPNGNGYQVITMEEPTTITMSKRVPQNEADKDFNRVVQCSYMQLDDVYTLLDDPFNTTKALTPKYTLEENFVDVHTDENFLVNSVIFKYIRRPQRMSKSLGVGCELPEHTHQEIVEMAIKSMLEGIQDPRYNSQAAEVAESE